MLILCCKLDAFIVRASNLLSSCHGIVTLCKPKEKRLNKHAINVTKMIQFTTICENKEKHIYAQVWKVNTKHV